MKMISLKCPSCGGQLSVENGRDFTFCQYCGTKILLEKDNEFTYRHIDDADIKRAETERIVRIKELELEQDKRRTRKITIIVWAAATGLLFLIGIILSAIDNKGISTAGYLSIGIGMNIGIWGAIFIFIVPKNKLRQANNSNSTTSASNSNFRENKTYNSELNKGANLKYNMALNAIEASQGITKTIQIKKDVLCPTCNGTGFINTTRCNQCGGTGRYSTLKPLSVTIPPGMNSGNMLIVKDEGDPGLNGGPNGDLYIEILVR